MKRITKLHPWEVFVFGSNMAGIHGAGAAKDAVKFFGAKFGVAEGYEGRSYAIPTKDSNLKPLSLATINYSVQRFISYTLTTPELIYRVTPIGCGLAGYTPAQIAPMFRRLLAHRIKNVILPPEFNKILL